MILFAHLVKKHAIQEISQGSILRQFTNYFPSRWFLYFPRPLIVVNVMIPLKLNLSTYYVRQNPFNSAYLSSPPLPSWVVKGKVPVCRLISDCLVCSASSVRPKYQLWLGNLEARNSSKNDKRKVSKDIDCSILNAKDVNFCWMRYISKLNPILPLDAKCVREYWLR